MDIVKTLFGTSVVLGVIFLIVLWILSPFALIWAVNTLFSTGINYSFWTWLATLVILFFLNGDMEILKINNLKINKN